MKKLVVVINKYSGAGRSTIAEVVEQLLERKGLKVGRIHTDEGDRTSRSVLWDLEDDMEVEALGNHLDGGDTTIIDVAARYAGILTELFEDDDVYELLGELDTELTVAIPISRGVDMTDEVVRLGEAFSDNADYVIVHNAISPDSNDVDYWARSYGQKAMSYLGAVEVHMPDFPPGLLAELASSHEMGVAAALAKRKSLPRFLRDELHRWELAFAAALGEAETALVTSHIDHSRSVYANARLDDESLD